MGGQVSLNGGWLIRPGSSLRDLKPEAGLPNSMGDGRPIQVQLIS
ncbi:hypothetical protein PR003_g948 [Phytophthora rubi]|uniref:Uncharacterized protein n=1 Tax=Phytophthora rubi TaxID=129364 RepID=A0A6A4G1Y5_9STRA|nr:hypothetical protein PR003_g948 [Phytophthora rubi]